jgi:predicted phosphoribosyltransferase
MFRNREDAGRQLAAYLKRRPLHDPIVLAIPRGGVPTGAALSRELGADFDVILSRKLRAPYQPESAVGAVAEDGQVYIDHHAKAYVDLTEEYLAEERRCQLAEISKRSLLFRQVRPRASLARRSVIVSDDGVATGSTMIAALQAVWAQNPREVVVAVPVASAERLEVIRPWCDEVVCILVPHRFASISRFYEDFSPVDDSMVADLLRQRAVSLCVRQNRTAIGRLNELPACELGRHDNCLLSTTADLVRNSI